MPTDAVPPPYGMTALTISRVPQNASCQGKTVGAPPNSNIVLTAPWNAANLMGRVIWSIHGGLIDGAASRPIVVPPWNTMVWPAPVPPTLTRLPVRLHWETQCQLRGDLSPWFLMTQPFLFGPPPQVP